MKEFIRVIVTIGIIILVVYIQREYFPKIEEVKTVSIDTLYIQRDSIVYKDKLIPYAVSLPPDTVRIPVDTVELVRRYLAIHKEFYTIKYYRDTFLVDTLGTFNISQKITQNRVDSLVVGWNLKESRIIYTQTIVNPKNSLYIGGLIGKKNVSSMILYSRENRTNYFVSYNLVTCEFSGGILININRLRK